ncbi:hypothetical protein EON65_56590, partial [archaeon]
DSTIIVQHVCSVLIFVCCFAAISSNRVRPESVVGWATGGTVVAWGFRDKWQSRSEEVGEDIGRIMAEYSVCSTSFGCEGTDDWICRYLRRGGRLSWLMSGFM